MALMGLDVGSTGCKSLVFSENGQQLAYAYEEYPPRTGDLDAEALLAAVFRVMGAAAAKAGEPVRALSISTFGESFVPVDANHRPVADIVFYNDDRALAEGERLEAVFREKGYDRVVGVRPHAMYSLPKIAFMEKHLPDQVAKTAKYLLIQDFIVARLCGEAYTDYATACRSMAFDVVGRCWSADVLALVGLTADKFATPVPSGTAVGTLLPEVAEALGMPRDCRVVTGAHDQISAAVGAGAMTPGMAVNGMGTVECITPIFSGPNLTQPFLDDHYVCVPHAIEGLYATYAFSFTGGAMIQWFRDKMMPHLKQAPGGFYAAMEQMVPHAPTDLLVVPHFAASATPDMQTWHRGAIYGLTLDTDPGALYRGLMEGVAYESCYNMHKLAEHGVRFKYMNVVGGGARSRLWLQIKADILNVPLCPLEVEEAGLTGTAMMAAVAMGDYASLQEASERFVKPREWIYPGSDAGRYAEQYARYAELRNKVTKG